MRGSDASRRRRARTVGVGSGIRAGACAASLLVAVACGGEDPTGPGAPVDGVGLLVLNSTGQTLARWTVVGAGISPDGAPIDLGAGFDGDAVAVTGDLAAATVSSFGGSRIVLVDLASGSVGGAGFPSPEGALANPSRPSFDMAGTLWVAGRGSDAVYRLVPGASIASRVASDVGTFVERVVPFGDELFAIDANLDDDGGSYLPNGPGRVVVLGRDGARREVIPLPASAPNPSDAVIAAGRIVILAGGTFDPVSFAPRGDGAIVLLDPDARSLGAPLPLEANGIGIETGADGFVYVTTTRDFATIEVLRLDPASGSFDRGPDAPIRPLGDGAEPADCWSATALADGRLVCVTFRSDAPGRLLLTQPSGAPLVEIPSGFGSTDVLLR